MLCLRIFVLFTLRKILNAIVCCLQLNTRRGADANPKVDFLGIDACWIAVYVLCCNALSKSHISHHDMYVHCMPSLFVNCPTVICSPNMLFLIGETPLVNRGPRSILLHWIQSTANIVLYCSSQTNIIFHTIQLIISLKQAGEIDNLTVTLGQSTLIVLCRFHVGTGIPGVAPHYTPSPTTFTWPSSPTGSINLGFLLRENLLLYASRLPLGVPNGRVLYRHKEATFWCRCNPTPTLARSRSSFSFVWT